MRKCKNLKSSQGFTLVELLVVLMIMAILTATLYLIFNPLTQLNKAKDAQRRHDLEQVRQALDTYFNDNGCYPLSGTVPFGSEWSVGGTVYMKKMPQDPDCYKTGYCYFYLTDPNNNCPQWNVLYTKLSMTPSPFKVGRDAFNAFVDANCPTQKVCQYRNSIYTYCVLSGNVECSIISGTTFPNRGVPSVPTSMPTLTPTAPVTPPITGVDCRGGTYYVNIPPCNSANPPASWCSIFGAGGAYDCYPNSSCSGMKCAQ